MSTTIYFHANDPQATTVISKHYPAGPSHVEFNTIDIKQGNVEISLFLNLATAKAIHVELERLYPSLALPLCEGDVDALAMSYAEGHAGDPATVSVDDSMPMVIIDEMPAATTAAADAMKRVHDAVNAPIAHSTPSDEAIAEALDELAGSANAAKFGAPCDGNDCEFKSGQRRCEASDNGRWSCTLPAGHAGQHSACSFDEHNIHVWPSIAAHNANVVALVNKAMGLK